MQVSKGGSTLKVAEYFSRKMHFSADSWSELRTVLSFTICTAPLEVTESDWSSLCQVKRPEGVEELIEKVTYEFLNIQNQDD